MMALIENHQCEVGEINLFNLQNTVHHIAKSVLRRLKIIYLFLYINICSVMTITSAASKCPARSSMLSASLIPSTQYGLHPK